MIYTITEFYNPARMLVDIVWSTYFVQQTKWFRIPKRFCAYRKMFFLYLETAFFREWIL